jgi:hypothetical protein
MTGYEHSVNAIAAIPRLDDAEIAGLQQVPLSKVGTRSVACPTCRRKSQIEPVRRNGDWRSAFLLADLWKLRQVTAEACGQWPIYQCVRGDDPSIVAGI